MCYCGPLVVVKLRVEIRAVRFERLTSLQTFTNRLYYEKTTYSTHVFMLGVPAGLCAGTDRKREGGWGRRRPAHPRGFGHRGRHQHWTSQRPGWKLYH